MDNLPPGKARRRPGGDVGGLAKTNDEEHEELFDYARRRVRVKRVLYAAGEPVDEREPVKNRRDNKVRVERAEGNLDKENVVVPGDLADAKGRVLAIVVVLLAHVLAIADPKPIPELGNVDDDLLKRNEEGRKSTTPPSGEGRRKARGD